MTSTVADTAEGVAKIQPSSTGISSPMPPATATPPDFRLAPRSEVVSFDRPDLREVVTTRVLDLFTWSLGGTLVFAALLVLIDATFIYGKVIKPDERLMTGGIIQTFVTATVVQVGAALAAIVYAVFKTAQAQSRDGIE